MARKNGKSKCPIFSWSVKAGVCTGVCGADNGGVVCGTGSACMRDPGLARKLKTAVGKAHSRLVSVALL